MVSKEEVLRDITLASTQKELMDKGENEKLDLLELICKDPLSLKIDWSNLTDEMLDAMVVLTSATQDSNKSLLDAIDDYRLFLDEFTLYIDPDLERIFIRAIKKAWNNATKNQISEFSQTLMLASKEAIKKTDLIKSSVLITRKEARKYNKYIEAREEQENEPL